VFVAPAAARPPSLTSEGFLQDMVIRGAALGMTADELSVGVLSLAGIRPPPFAGRRGPLVECSPPELDFFARNSSHLPVLVDRCCSRAAGDHAAPETSRSLRAAVTSFCHLPQVEQL